MPGTSPRHRFLRERSPDPFRTGRTSWGFHCSYIAIELSRLIAAKTKLDILLAPLAGILGGSLVGIWVGPPISRLMNQLGAMINWGTEQQPFLMGIVVSVLMGMILTLPISSAALGVILNLSGWPQEPLPSAVAAIW